MTRTTILAIVLLALSGAANAAAVRVMDQPEDAYELRLADVSLPGSLDGSVTFRACSDCRTTALRITPTTVFQVNTQHTDLESFSEAAQALRGRGGGGAGTAVYIFFNVDSRRATRLVLDSFE
jgi:hypothetical protein